MLLDCIVEDFDFGSLVAVSCNGNSSGNFRVCLPKQAKYETLFDFDDVLDKVPGDFISPDIK